MAGPAAGGGGPPTVESDVPVTAMDLAKQTANNSPLLVTDPSDDRVVFLANRLDGPDFGCALQVSTDGGRSWRTLDPVPMLPPGADKCYAPEAAFDRDGTLNYLFVGLHGQGNTPMGAFLVTSTDGGQRWSGPRTVLGADRFQVRMAIDPAFGKRGRMHLVWVEAGASPGLGGFGAVDNPIMASYSDDGGRTFSIPVRVSDVERRRPVAPAVALGPGHRVHVAYYDLGDDIRDYQGLEGPRWEGNWSLVVSTSHDGGDYFGAATVVDDGLIPATRVMLIFTMPPPALAADTKGRLYAGWDDARGGDSDVYVRSSSDGGRHWDDRSRLNDDPHDSGLHQYLPHLSVAPDGRVDAAFYDRRLNPANLDNDVFYTWSADHGRRWAPNVRVSSSSFDSQTGPRYGVPSAQGLVELGGRIALRSEKSHVLAAWTDTRNDNRGGTAQEIFANEIGFPRSASRSEAPALVGGCVAVLILAGLVAGRHQRRRVRVSAS